MERTPVQSSNIASVGYDPASKVLEVEFTNGAVYQYADVPAGLTEQFLRSESLGRFLARNIRDRFAAKKLAA